MATDIEFAFDFASLQRSPWGSDPQQDPRPFFAPGLFADLTNSTSGQSKSTTPSTSDDGLRSTQPNGESPGAAIAMRVAELMVTPEAARRVRPTALFTMSPANQKQLDAPKILIVEHKMNRRQRISCPPSVKALENDFVIIQLQQNVGWAGDVPPLDVGQVIGVYSQADRHLVPRSLGYDAGVVVRVADVNDCDIINNVLPELEATALRHCHQLINFLNAPFVAVDAEYSYDRRQVRLFCVLSPSASTSNAPNVGRLQKELSIRLRCRVVIEQLKPDAVRVPQGSPSTQVSPAQHRLKVVPSRTLYLPSIEMF